MGQTAEASREASRDVSRAEYERMHGYGGRGLSRHVARLCREGRVEGAYKDEDGNWRMPADAKILPPTEAQRELWRRQWKDRRRTREQRLRRARARAGGS